MFFDSWYGLLRVAVVGALGYVALVLLLRVAGNRTLSKLNAFDLVVTVALGSTLATVLLSETVSLAEGTLAFAVLIGLQFAVTWGSIRWSWIDRVVKSEPLLLVYRGTFLHTAMRQARVVDSEVFSVLRDAGVTDPAQAEAVVLESDGSFSVLRDSERAPVTLADVRAPGVELAPGRAPAFRTR